MWNTYRKYANLLVDFVILRIHLEKLIDNVVSLYVLVPGLLPWEKLIFTLHVLKVRNLP